MKYSLFFSDLNGTWVFSTSFQKILKYQISEEYVQLSPSCSTRVDWRPEGTIDRRTDMAKIIVAFRNFA
jgi:hypothetical protein